MTMNSTPHSAGASPLGARPSRLYPWIASAVLFLLGGFFLLHATGVLVAVDRWWALVLLLPAAVLAGTAWAQYQASGGRLTPAVGGALVASLVLTALAAIFLLALPWGMVWPVFLIIGGVAALLPRSGRRRGDRG